MQTLDGTQEQLRAAYFLGWLVLFGLALLLRPDEFTPEEWMAYAVSAFFGLPALLWITVL